jgi:hypothetical protein
VAIPVTPGGWERLSVSKQESRIRAAKAVGAQRRDPSLSLAAAARREGTTPDTVLRYFGAYYTYDSIGSMRPAAWDAERFAMNIYSTRGILEAIAQDSSERSLAGRHTAAVNYFGDTGATHQLSDFTDATVGGQRLETDPDRLLIMLARDRIDFLDIYST